jgi:hypothetical protein
MSAALRSARLMTAITASLALVIAAQSADANAAAARGDLSPAVFSSSGSYLSPKASIPGRLATDLASDADIATFSSDEALKRKVLSDSRVVSLKVGNTLFAIPRNYLQSKSAWGGGRQENIIFLVTYPGFQPFNHETADCFRGLARCQKLEITVAASFQTDLSIFHNLFDLFKNKDDPGLAYGYEVFHLGPAEVGEEWFYSFDGAVEIAFSCTKHVICYHHFSPCINLTIYYVFPYARVPESKSLAARVAQFVKSFIQGGCAEP